MTNPSKRGSAPGRAREASGRSGSFEMGHEKRGGRKRGTPNFFSRDYKKAIVEAAYRVGEDGNGKDGVVGYFSWIAECHPRSYAMLLSSVLSMELADPATSEEPLATAEENDQHNQHIRDYIGLKGRNRTNTVQPKSQSRQTWTGQPFPVGGLMQLAVEHPKEFCTLLGAAFFRPPAKRRQTRGPEAGAA